MTRNNHPSFKRPNLSVNARIRDRWRKPRGNDSKQRMHLVWAGALPDVGYRSPKDVRGKHPSGKDEVLVAGENELVKVPKDSVIRFSSKLGEKTRVRMRKWASDKGIRTLN